MVHRSAGIRGTGGWGSPEGNTGEGVNPRGRHQQPAAVRAAHDVPGMQVGSYTIVLLPILYGVWHTQRGGEEVWYTAPIVVQ